MSWSNGYTYRKSITLSRASGAVTLYQLKLLVGESAGSGTNDVHCAGHCQPGFQDVVFTNSNGDLLNFWIEALTGDSPNQVATFWIKFDSIGTAATTFYMYYGKSSPLEFVYYNGTATTVGGPYCIGCAYGNADYGFTKFAQNPVLGPGPGTYDSASAGVKNPFVIKIGNKYVMYYTGTDSGSGATSICIATSYNGIRWTKYGSNPVLTKGTTGQWDDAGVSFSVVYDTGVAGAKRYRMLYAGQTGSTYQTGYAYSSDGLSWTKGASNPVIAIGGVGAWDHNQAAVTSNPYLNGSTYYVYYGGYNGTIYQIGLVTFTDFEGVYSKNGGNPIIPSRTTSTQTLTAQTNSGTKTVKVADTSVFQVNEPVFMYDGSNSEFNRVASITDGQNLVLVNNAVRNYPSGTSSIISWMKGSNTPSFVKVDSGTWKLYFSAFQAISGVNRETTAYATSSDGISWTIDYADSPPISFDPSTVAWDQYSAENPSLIQNPGGISSSSGSDTFLFFDDFPGVSLNAQWNSTQGTPSVLGGVVTLKSGVTWDAIRASGYSVTYARVRTKFMYSAVTNHAVGLSSSAVTTTFYAADSEYFLGVTPTPFDIYGISSHAGTLSQNSILHTVAGNTFYTGEFRWESGKCVFYINDGSPMTHTTNVASIALNPRADGTHVAASGNEIIDWLFVSQYLDPEPAWGAWGAESQGLTGSYADSITISDGVSLGASRSLSDGISLVDSIGKTSGKFPSDGITLSDLFSKIWTISRALSDGFSLSDAIAKTPGLTKSDAILLSDIFSKVWAANLSLSDAISLIDAISKTPTLAKSDALTLTDLVTYLKMLGLSLSDTISLSDVMSKIFSHIEDFSYKSLKLEAPFLGPDGPLNYEHCSLNVPIPIQGAFQLGAFQEDAFQTSEPEVFQYEKIKMVN